MPVVVMWFLIPTGAPLLDEHVLEESDAVEARVRQLFEAPPAVADSPLVSNLHESDSEDTGTVLVWLQGNFKTKCRRFARTTRITDMWKVIGRAMRGRARLRISSSGQEVALDATLGHIVVGNHGLTLELRCPGVGGGEEADRELSHAADRGDKEGVSTALSRGANVNAKDDFVLCHLPQRDVHTYFVCLQFT